MYTVFIFICHKILKRTLLKIQNKEVNFELYSDREIMVKKSLKVQKTKKKTLYELHPMKIIW